MHVLEGAAGNFLKDLDFSLKTLDEIFGTQTYSIEDDWILGGVNK